MDNYFGFFGLPGTFVLTTLLSASALALAVIFRSPARWLCFAAMLFSTFGDLCMTRFMGIDRVLPNYFAVGAGFFMAAHLLYTFCYLGKIRASGAAVMNPGVLIMAAIAIVFAIGFVRMCSAQGRTDQLPLILTYIVLISLSCAMVFSHAWSQGLKHPLAILAAVGAVSFFLSDLIIGMDLVFGGQKYWNMIWWLYPIGQMLLIAGVGKG